MNPETTLLWVFVLATAGSEILALLPIKPNSWLGLVLVILRAIGDSRRGDRSVRR